MTQHSLADIVAAIEKSTHKVSQSDFGSGWWRDRLDDIASRLTRWSNRNDFLTETSARAALVRAWRRAREDNKGSEFGDHWWVSMLNTVLSHLGMSPLDASIEDVSAPQALSSPTIGQVMTWTDMDELPLGSVVQFDGHVFWKGIDVDAGGHESIGWYAIAYERRLIESVVGSAEGDEAVLFFVPATPLTGLIVNKPVGYLSTGATPSADVLKHAQDIISSWSAFEANTGDTTMTISTEAVLAKYGPQLTNTGGNDPADLLHRLNTEDNLVRTNLPVFTCAVAVQAQVELLKKLVEAGDLSLD